MLKNLVALVTGGASGLGRATVNRFAGKGTKVVFCDLPTSNGKEVAEEIGENAHFVPADVRSESDVKNVIAEVQKKYGKLDLLVNCAGVESPRLTYDLRHRAPNDIADFENVFNTKVVGTFNVSRLAIGLMNKNKPNEDGLRGLIVNTASVLSITSSFGHASEASASGAITSMTLPMALDLSNAGIRVVTIATGIMDTDHPQWSPMFKNTIQEDLVSSPHRLGEPDEFAHLVQMITTNPAINETTIELSGGLR